MVRIAILMAAGLAAGQATAASAAIVAFSGARTNMDSPGPQSARCGARTTINIRNSANSTSTGTSNFGGFAATLSHCIQLPPPVAYDLGEFSFDFASGDQLFGTYSGTLTFNAPGVFNILQDHLVTGGTGLFLGATGAFTSMGTLSFVTGVPTGQQTFDGTLNAPGIPEPASWAMMVAGFGLVGATLRRRVPVPAA